MVADFIDVHAHFLPDFYIAAVGGAPDGMPAWPPWNIDAHLAMMDEQRIRTSILSISSPGVHFGNDAAAAHLARQVNDYGAGLARERPQRFGHFASLPLPDVEVSLVELARALDELGSDGLAVETNTDGIYLGNARYEPLWAEAERRGAIIFVHPTSAPGGEKVSLGRAGAMLEFIFDSTRAASDLLLSGVLERYTRIRWIFTHGGGALPLMADRIELFRTVFPGERSMGGPSARQLLSGLWYDLAGTPFPQQVPALVGAFGNQKVLYGSDFCFTPAVAVARQMRDVIAAVAPAGSSSWKDLTYRNALELFPRLHS